MIKRWQASQCCRTPGLSASWMHCSSGAFPEPIPAKGEANSEKFQTVWDESRSPQLLAAWPNITCEGMECGATDVASCHSSAGCSIGAVWREGAHDLLQQE